MLYSKQDRDPYDAGAGMMPIDKTVVKQKLMSPAAEQMADHATDAAGLMKALGNESRLMILCTLADG